MLDLCLQPHPNQVYPGDFNEIHFQKCMIRLTAHLLRNISIAILFWFYATLMSWIIPKNLRGFVFSVGDPRPTFPGTNLLDTVSGYIQ